MAGGNFRPFTVSGSGIDRTVQYADAITGRQVLAGGAAVAVTAISCAALIPPTTRIGCFQYAQRGVVDANLYDDPANAIASMQRTLIGGSLAADRLRISATRDIAYANVAGGGAVDVWVTGYEESL